VVVGNGLEYYDFVTYAFFRSQIGRTFFPSNTPGRASCIARHIRCGISNASARAVVSGAWAIVSPQAACFVVLC